MKVRVHMYGHMCSLEPRKCLKKCIPDLLMTILGTWVKRKEELVLWWRATSKNVFYLTFYTTKHVLSLM